MKRRLALVAIIAAIAGGIIGVAMPASSDHGGPTLPGLPTPVITRVIQRGFVTYRLDANAAAYPGFRAQAADVALEGFWGIGVGGQETTGTPDIWLTMPDDATFIATCGSGAAGCILYWADPIMIYFRRALLYSDWKSTLAHEGINYGHAMGEHEQYYDRTFTCKSLADLNRLGPGPTVMSCGTGLWKPQPFDVATVCSVLDPAGSKFTGCMEETAIECSFLGYDECSGRWRFADKWSWNPTTGEWFGPTDLLEYSACNRDGIRWAFRIARWTVPTSNYFDPALGYWSRAPEC